MYRIPLEKMNMKVNTGPFVFDILLDMAFTKEGLPSSGETLMHCHPAYEIHFIIGGKLFLKLEHGEIPVQAGDIVLVPPNVFHGFKANPFFEKGYFQFTYTLKESHDDLFPEVEIAEMLKTLTGLKEVTVLRSADVLHLITSIQTELQSNRMYGYTKIQSLFTQLLIDLFRVVPDQPVPHGEQRQEYRFPLKTIDDSRTRIIDMFIGRVVTFKEPLSIEFLAQQLNLSIKQTQRVIRQLYGKSYKQIVIDSQMEIAKDLLQTSNMSIAQIAEQSGFMDTEHFKKRFTYLTGQTPAQYRNLRVNKTSR